MKALVACAVGAACAVLAYGSVVGWRSVARRAPIELRENVRVTGVLGEGDAEFQDYAIDVPAGVVAARFDAQAGAADLLVSLRYDERVGDEGEADLVSDESEGSGPLRIDQRSETTIRPGRWFLRVACVPGTEPIAADGGPRPVEYSLLARMRRAGSPTALKPGRRVADRIPAHEFGSRTFVVGVPADASALRIDVVEADGDVDLFAAPGSDENALDGAELASVHAYGRETIVVDAAEGLRPGPWIVEVTAPWDDDRAVQFALLVTYSADVPEELQAIPELPRTNARATAELARAACAVVELTTDDGSGSGVLVGEAGWILTNAHVVEAQPGVAADEVVVGCALVTDRPAVELFRGRVVELDAERDLALVRVVSGFYGQPVPDAYRFPTVELGDPRALRLGSPLWLVGYPATGGEGSRVTLHATRGIVAGFERGELESLVKTDAEIAQGNSGGAALDEAGRLVGIPTSRVESGSGQSGYVRPTDLVPRAWLELVRGR